VVKEKHPTEIWTWDGNKIKSIEYSTDTLTDNFSYDGKKMSASRSLIKPFATYLTRQKITTITF